MGRWEPNAEGRLREAAMELFLERGYEQTTVADIAERAGLTSRTFFRYFADKREVLFVSSQAFEEPLVEALEATPAEAPPMAAVAAALDAFADLVGGNREHTRARQSVIDSSAELRERELIKMATIAAALAEAGFALADVVRAHYYVSDRAYVDRVFPILGEHFGAIRPAATMIMCALNKPEMKIEIEVTALKRDGSTRTT